MQRNSRRLMFALWIASFGLFALFERGARAEILVREVKADKGYVVLSVLPEDGVTQGALLDGQVGSGTCRLKVYYVKGSQAAATTKGCPEAAQLEPNHPFALAVAGSAAGTPKPEPAEEEGDPFAGRSNPVSYHHFGVHLYYSLASSVAEKFTATGTTQGTAVNLTSDTTYSGPGALGFGLRYTLIKRREHPRGEFHLGGMLGYSYELSRSMTSATDNSTKSTTTLKDLKIGVSVIETNLVGEFSRFYFFLGPNYSIISASGTDASPDYETTGTLGTQVGAGFLLGPVGLEILYRTVNAKVTSLVEGIDATTESDRLWGLMFRAQISFP